MPIVIPIVVVVTVAAFALNSLVRQSGETGASAQALHDRSQLITTTALRLIQLQEEVYDAIVSYRHEQEERYLEERRRDDREIARLAEDLKHRLDSSTCQGLLAGYQMSREGLARLEESFIEAMRAGRTGELDRLLRQIDVEKRTAASRLHSLLSHTNEELCSRIFREEEALKAMRRTLILRTATLGFVLCILLAITWSILRPLHQMTEAANRMADGDLSVRIDVKSHYGEINQLAQDFEKMRERVKDNHAVLELRIAQRTLDLRRSQDRLELALAADDAGLWDWEPEAKRMTCNKSWAEMLGYKEEELKREEDSFFEKIHPEDVDAVRKRLADHASGHTESYESMHRLRTKNGEWIWVLGHGRVVERNAQGEATRVIGLVRDISHRRRAEEELTVKTRGFEEQARDLTVTRQMLVRKDEELRQLVRAVSGDVRSSLASLKRIVGRLKDDARLEKSDGVLESIEAIEAPANHARRLIDDLVEVSEAAVALARRPVDVSSIVADLTPGLQSRLDAADARLEVQAGMSGITGDRAAIKKVFEELLNNAITFGCNGSSSKVTVGSVSMDDEVRFFVKDNGPGIRPENHKKVFELFERLGGKDMGSDEGTGAGLAIVERIMQVHHGRVWVESSPGRGATFWISFETVRDRDSERAHAESERVAV